MFGRSLSRISSKSAFGERDGTGRSPKLGGGGFFGNGSVVPSGSVESGKSGSRGARKGAAVLDAMNKSIQKKL